MKFITIFACILFIYIIGTEAGPRCNKACTREYNPVCGTLRRPNGRIIQCTFSNPCMLRVRSCQAQEQWTSVPGICRRQSLECAGMRRSG
ncbi:turripeptide Pal9.2-like [Cochliomyia hominivorax]